MNKFAAFVPLKRNKFQVKERGIGWHVNQIFCMIEYIQFQF